MPRSSRGTSNAETNAPINAPTPWAVSKPVQAESEAPYQSRLAQNRKGRSPPSSTM